MKGSKGSNYLCYHLGDVRPREKIENSKSWHIVRSSKCLLLLSLSSSSQLVSYLLQVTELVSGSLRVHMHTGGSAISWIGGCQDLPTSEASLQNITILATFCLKQEFKILDWDIWTCAHLHHENGIYLNYSWEMQAEICRNKMLWGPQIVFRRFSEKLYIDSATYTYSYIYVYTYRETEG